MSNSTSATFNIGYGNSSYVARNGDLYTIDLYCGDLAFDVDFVKLAINNWGDNSILDSVNTNGLSIWFDSYNNHLITDDYDGCGFDWSLDDFINYTNI